MTQSIEDFIRNGHIPQDHFYGEGNKVTICSNPECRCWINSDMAKNKCGAEYEFNHYGALILKQTKST